MPKDELVALPCPFCGDPMTAGNNLGVIHKRKIKTSRDCILYHIGFQSVERWNTRALAAQSTDGGS